jgi:hypothetical protein
MATNSKVPALTALAEAPDNSDVLYIVDVSDTTDDATGTSKHITAANLKSGLATSSSLTNHTGNTSNPHQVTADQVLPSQSSNSGKYLTTNGTTASWGTVTAGSGDMKADGTVDFTAVVAYNADKTFSTDQDLVSKKYVDEAIVAAGGYTDEQAQDAVGGALTDTDTIDFTYTDANGTITAAVKDGSISLAKMANLAQNTIIGRVTASTGVPEALTAANVRTIINVADGATANTKAAGSDLDTGTDDAKFATSKALKDSHNVPSVAPGTSGNVLTSNGTDWTSATPAAVPVKATGAEVDTGTDDAKFVTAKAMEDSSYTKSALPLAGGTMTGSILQGENTSLQLDTTLSADEKYCGITELGTMGYGATVGDLVYLAAADTKWEKAQANAASTSAGKLGLVCATTSENSTCQVLLYGKMRSAAFPTLTVGAPVYISAATAGLMTATAPSGTTDFVVRKIGFGSTAEDLFFCPSNDYVELA